MSETALLTARGLGVRLAGRVVLKDVSLSLSLGHLVALVGPNGAGKTTLLRALSGLLPSDGEVHVGGAVAVTGTIAFIGLVAPHLMRPLIGHDPARLLVPSALAGSALLLAADIAVRIIPSTSDIKVGVLTSIIGVPFFLYLIARERRALGGGVA